MIDSVENTQPVEFTNIYVYASDPWHDVADGQVKFLSYEFFDDLPGGTLIDDTLYEEVQSTTITSFNDTGPDFLIDNAVPPANDLVGVFTSSPQIYPWFEIKLNKSVKMMGVEMTHPDWSSNNFVSRNIQFRAGNSPAPNLQQDTELTSMFNWSLLQNKHCFTISGLLTSTSDLLAEYTPELPPTAGDVTYITFSQPTDAKYLFVQADWSTAESLAIAEIRIFERRIENQNH